MMIIDTFSLPAALKNKMRDLEIALEQLAATLVQLELQEAHVYPLPAIALGEEDQPIDHIEVRHLTGNMALNAAVVAYQDHAIRPGCSTKATYRLPGWLRYPASAALVLSPLINEINQHKLAFKAIVQQAGGRDEKYELVHSSLPGVITLQVYRQIMLLEGELYSLGFTWADKHAIQRVSREEIIELLHRSRDNVPPLSNSDEWSRHIDKEIYDLYRLPCDAPLRIRRPVKTHPMINLRWKDKKPLKQQVKASLPLIFCADEPPFVTHLSHYPPKRRQARGDKKISEDAIIERLHLYLYEG